MSTIAITNRLDLRSAADTSLKVAVRIWFAVAILGQLVFAVAVASFYGLTALRGDFHAWARFITHGWVAGDSMGNLAIAMHVGSAVVIMLAGGLQLIPAVRNRFPTFHRWNGRVYMLTAVMVSVAGLYMTWIRGSTGDLSQHLASTLNAVLIWVCAAMALRYAIARNFKTHRRWALRLFLVASAAWFYRISFFLTLAIFKGPVGFDPQTFTGPLLTFMSFAQYLVPLAILELYFQAQDHPGASGRFAMAGGLFVLTIAMAAGLLAVTMAVWVPDVKAGFDSRKSIAEAISPTIASSGIDEAVKKYHELKSTQAATYSFDEPELNTLGYQLIRKKKFKEGIRIFQLNIESYPQSSNAYDSLAEGYLDDGDKSQAIANYQKAVQLNPKNRNSILMLQKLNTP